MSSGARVQAVDDEPAVREVVACDRAFEPFTRADPARDVRTGHSGLGLAIARAVVEAHGGRIWLANGHGADVRFAIPRREPG